MRLGSTTLVKWVMFTVVVMLRRTSVHVVHVRWFTVAFKHLPSVTTDVLCIPVIHKCHYIVFFILRARLGCERASWVNCAIFHHSLFSL